jgi:hypothetical protein
LATSFVPGPSCAASRLEGGIFPPAINAGLQHKNIFPTGHAERECRLRRQAPCIAEQDDFLAFGISSMRPRTSRHSMLCAVFRDGRIPEEQRLQGAPAGGWIA